MVPMSIISDTPSGSFVNLVYKNKKKKVQKNDDVLMYWMDLKDLNDSTLR